MKIYLDVIFLINFGFDFLLLLVVKLVLKRKTKLFRIFLGALLGSLSIFCLFMKLNSFTLFLLKGIVSIIMILIAFGKENFGKNIVYLYFVSILLGGFLYCINLQVSYKNEGFLFFYNGFSLNLLLLFLLSPIILYWYYRQSRYFQDTLSNIHTVEIIFSERHYSARAYLDTGNKLYDPFKHREVTLLYDPILYEKQDQFLFIPFQTLASSGFVKGIIAEKMIIDDKYIFEDVLIGLSNHPFALEEAKVILHANFKNKLF